MKKIYHLKTCNTCQKIIAQVNVHGDFELQNIKEDKITKAQLTEMKEMVGSYEELFSRRAMKYRSMGLNDMELTEKDYEKYILEEYTFLKRPVIVIDDEIFVGNSKKVVEQAIKKLK